MATQILKQNYAEEVRAIKEAISVSRYSVARQANTAQLGLYYSVGGYISQHTRNAKWGTGALNVISQQLQQEMPGLKGFSEGNMRKMRLFYEAWQPVFEPRTNATFDIVPFSGKIEIFDFCSPLANELDAEKRSPLANELSEYDLKCFLQVGFTLHSDIILQTKEVKERWFYIRKVANEFIGKRQLQLHLKHDLYHQQGTMPNNFAVTLTDEQQRAVAMQTFRENKTAEAHRLRSH